MRKPQRVRAAEDVGSAVSGEVCLYRVWDDGVSQLLSRRKNQLQVSWGFIAAMCIGLGRRDYKISGLYIEYENVADPSDTVVPPTPSPHDQLEYYNDLSLSGSRDYLRVPLTQDPMFGIVTGYESDFVAGDSGNQLTVFAVTQGSVGVHGKPFGAASNSKIYGAALVAIPTFQDPTLDVIFARKYYDEADQAVKLPSSQFGVTWMVNFPLPS